MTTGAEQRRLRRSVVLHGVAVVVFAMLALSGAATAAPGLYGLAVPSIVTGTAGAVGAALIAVSVWRAQRGDAAATGRQRTVRLAMAAAAVVAMIAGVVLAPSGIDRGFVITVAGVLAGALALFALLSGDRPRS